MVFALGAGRARAGQGLKEMTEDLHEHTAECRRIFALLSEFLDGELPADTCEQVAAHIKDCPPCIAFMESLRKTVELCRAIQAGEQPRPLDPAAREELRALYQKMLAARGVRHGDPGDSAKMKS